jgi:hypothetical protein
VLAPGSSSIPIPDSDFDQATLRLSHFGMG